MEQFTGLSLKDAGSLIKEPRNQAPPGVRELLLRDEESEISRKIYKMKKEISEKALQFLISHSN